MMSRSDRMDQTDSPAEIAESRQLHIGVKSDDQVNAGDNDDDIDESAGAGRYCTRSAVWKVFSVRFRQSAHLMSSNVQFAN
jgi:hypothetical protein